MTSLERAARALADPATVLEVAHSGPLLVACEHPDGTVHGVRLTAVLFHTPDGTELLTEAGQHRHLPKGTA